jgi:oxygen-independent coproporphyrinogen-3 oxidase
VIDAKQLPFEFALNAFRLIEGFSVDLFSQRTGLPRTALEAGMHAAQARALVHREGQWIRPTDHGQRFLDDLVALFLPAQK